jgi:signal peptidase I
VRDVSPSAGRPDDHGEASTAGGDRDPARQRALPRHLAGGSAGRRGITPDGAEPPTDDQHEPPAHGRHRKHSVGRTVLEWVGVIGCGIVIALTAQAFLVQAFWIPSPSMEPTLEVGDRVLVNKLSYKVHDVNHGDLVVFERPPQASNGENGEIKDLIKRVIAVGGDTIECRDNAVYINRERIDEPYLADGTPACGAGSCELQAQEIRDGDVFVMGDNRTNSEDSRCFGAIDEDTIVGRAFVKVLPLGDFGWL